MDFRKATDELCASITHDKFAKELKSSVAAIRQARLGSTAKAHRNPPEGWERVAARLAKKRARELLQLAARLEAL